MEPTAKSRIAELRDRAELTQAELAVLVGVTTNTIQNWEGGKSGVEQIVKFLKLCTILDCQLQDLVDIEPASHASESKPGKFSLRDLQKLRERWDEQSSSPSKQTTGNKPEAAGRT